MSDTPRDGSSPPPPPADDWFETVADASPSSASTTAWPDWDAEPSRDARPQIAPVRAAGVEPSSPGAVPAPASFSPPPTTSSTPPPVHTSPPPVHSSSGQPASGQPAPVQASPAQPSGGSGPISVGGVAPQTGAQPPASADWNQAATSPPSGLPIGLASPPTAASYEHASASLAEKPRRGRRLASGLGIGALGFLLGAGSLAGGYQLGQNDLEGTTTPQAEVPTDRDVGVDLPGVDDDDEPDLRSAAVPEEATGDEPVASAAAVVSPAVVQIETGVGLGSGVIYDEAGFILTNAHVVGGATEVNVRLASGRTLPGRVIGAHEPTDIAVVQVVSDSALEAAPLALEGDLEVGQLTVAVGSPFGLDQTVTSGIVSAINRAVPSENGNFVGMLQTDAAINSGNSGGALADRYGRVIGINTAIRTTNGGNAGIGFAVPIGTAASVAEQLRAGQPVELGYLGVGLNEVEGPGALLTEVVRGSPAEGVLMTGDVVVALDGRPVSGPAELATAVKGRAPGSSVSVEVNRNGDPVTVDVELGGLEG